MIIPKIVEKILQSQKRLTVIPLKLSVAKIKWTANRCNSIEDYINLAFKTSNSFPFSIRPIQVKEEITELLKNFELFLLSPFRALHITLKKKCPQMLIVYPLDRWAILKAYLEWKPRAKS